MVDEYSVMTLVLFTKHFTFYCVLSRGNYYPDMGAWFICKTSKMMSHASRCIFVAHHQFVDCCTVMLFLTMWFTYRIAMVTGR
jgi:hypothetical protein